ncbi:hypothetical protein [Roseixanthobacter glucoisosaccharinicivorans]|uniref:hypothetical protein n=1 Tax=Roseixanthobacter glucoisosaccharinicivorans TaxID=3119923 RepID=UPI00372C99D1
MKLVKRYGTTPAQPHPRSAIRALLTPHVPVHAIATVITMALAALVAGKTPAAAEPLPVPSADFALKAKLGGRVLVDMSRQGNRMRMEISNPAVPGTLLGFLNIDTRKVVLVSPSLPKMGIETDLPADFQIASLAGEGTRAGTAEVAGEPCTLWQVEKAAQLAGPTTACITEDGIVLNTMVEIQGKPHLTFEVLSLKRGPQDPELFRLPPGTRTMKVPNGAGLLPSIGISPTP